MKATPLKEKVRQILEDYPSARDSDTMLFMRAWYSYSHTPLAKLLQAIDEGKAPHPESITRCRRKLQELHPELRGKRYKDRQTTEQQEMKQDIKFGDWQSVNIERPILTDTDHPNQLKIC